MEDARKFTYTSVMRFIRVSVQPRSIRNYIVIGTSAYGVLTGRTHVSSPTSLQNHVNLKKPKPLARTTASGKKRSYPSGIGSSISSRVALTTNASIGVNSRVWADVALTW